MMLSEDSQKAVEIMQKMQEIIMSPEGSGRGCGTDSQFHAEHPAD